MVILYLHGLGARFDLDSSKNIELLKMGEVIGFDIDYTKPSKENINNISVFTTENKVDVIVGNSLGGWLASWVGFWSNIPFVACNPSMVPNESLKETDIDEELYMPFNQYGDGDLGLILLDKGDKHFDYKKTCGLIEHYKIIKYEGGNHGFTHMLDALPEIKKHSEKTVKSFGDGMFK